MTTTTASPAAPAAQHRWTPPDWVTALSATITDAQRRYLGDMSGGRADLAIWREGARTEPMANPGMWKHIMRIVDEVPEARTGWRTQVQAAAHHALALYAHHQEHLHTLPMHIDDGRSLGYAWQQTLATPGQGTDAELQPFLNAAATITTTSLTHHLRQVIVTLRARRVPLDYGRLAYQISTWHMPDARKKSCRRWGVDLYTVYNRKDTETA